MKVRQVNEGGRYGSSNPDTMSPGNYDRYQQDQMDYGKREFKRREMEHELGHEDEQQRKEQSSTYYIRINGKLLKNKEGQPYQFRGKEAANKAAVTMMSKPFNRDKKFTLTTTASDKQDNPTPESSIAEMDGAPGQILAATGDKVTIDNKDGTQTIAPKASLTRDPTGKGFVLSKTPAPGGEKPDEPKPGETVFKPATTEGIEKMNEAIRMLRLAGLHKAADRLTEQLVERAGDEPMSDADYAKQMAQGQKNLNAVKGFFGGKPAAPAELKDAPPGTSIDPIVRQRMGYKPATQQDIAAFQAANPNAGKVVGGDGKPIKTGDGSDLVSGGGQAVTQAAQAAAPAAAPNPTDARLAAGTQTANTAAPAQATQKVDPGQADRDDADQGAAMRANAAGGNSTSAATGAGNPGEEAAAELARMKQLAGVPTAADQDDADMGAAMKANQTAAIGANQDAEDQAMGQAMTANAAQSAALASGAQDDATGVDKAVAANAAAPAAPTQAASPAKPAPAKAGFKADPIGQSIANQLKMTTPDAIKLFQKNNGLTADGQIGPATTKALQAAAKKMGVTTTSGVGTSTAGAGRGGQGGPTAAQLAAPRPGVNQPAAKPAPAKPLPGKRPFPGAGQISDNPAAEDRQFYEELDKMLTIARLR